MPAITEPAGGSTTQTLARGLRVLDVLADADGPLTIGEVCARLGVHRSIGYRLVRTLEDASLVVRDRAGALVLGPHLATLARNVARNLQADAHAVLQELADELGMTAFLVVLDRQECVTLVTVEPRHTLASIAQRPGSRHPVLVGAPGIAIQTVLTPSDREAMGLVSPESADVTAARKEGVAWSHGEVIPGVTAVAAPIRGPVRAAVAALFVGASGDWVVADSIRHAAATLGRSNR